MKFLLVFIPCLLLFTSSCKREVTSTSSDLNTNVAQYLVESPPPYLSVRDDIVLRFQRLVVEGHEESIHGVKIVPAVVGRWEWMNAQTLRFIPDDVLAYDTQYAIHVDMNQLTGSSDLNPLVTSFKTIPISLRIVLDQPDMKYKDDQVDVNIRGEIIGSDYVSQEVIEKMLDVVNENKKLSIFWNHTDRSHLFEINGLTVLKEEQQISLRWNGKFLDKSFYGHEEIQIDGAKQFSISDVTLVDQGSHHVRVSFTQPLNERQNLKGLITITDAEEYPRVDIDGNVMMVYPSLGNIEDFSLQIHQKIQSYAKMPLDQEYSFDLSIAPIKPAVRHVGGGVITPSSDGFLFAFEAINLDSIDVEIFKVYEDNMLQFLQESTVDQGWNLNHVGKIVHQEKLALSSLVNTNSSKKWSLYQLDLGQIVAAEKGSIYKVNIGFRPTYSNYNCDNNPMKNFEIPEDGTSIMMYRYNYNNYTYEHQDNPCYPSYYRPENFLQRNILFSNVAAIVKGGADNDYSIVTTTIDHGAPLGNVKVSLYDFQQQLLETSQTSSSGMSRISTSREAAFAVFEHAEGTAYVRMLDGESLSVSDFNTGGKKRSAGIDGYIYTDRGVYRPGDTVFVNFMLALEDINLPADHPVSISIKNARGTLVYNATTADHLDHIYTFKLPTNQGDPTGVWQAEILVGSVSFYKSIRIETVKPNRLKVELQKADLIRYARKSERKIDVNSKWLHGAPANGLRAVIDADWSAYTPVFEKYNDYVFIDPARVQDLGRMTLFDGLLNTNGKTSFNLTLNKEDTYPTMLKANLTTRVFEKGGDFSENYNSLLVSPYSNYVGIQVPKGDWGYASVKIGDSARINALTTDELGKPTQNRKLTIGVYDINWRWWYYSGQRYRIYELNSAEHQEAIYKTTAITNSEGEVSISIPTEEMEYGRKLVRICDPASGHCTGDFFYASGWNSSMTEDERSSLTRLSFVANKTSYKVGEEVELQIPSEIGSRILISIEDDHKVLIQDWIDGDEGRTIYKFGVNETMSPNVYAHVTLIQPQENLTNDLPIRMYGVIPISVTDPATILHPEILSADKFEPEKEFSIKITESDKREMNYTIAIVDEGLLDLTNYKTPSPHDYFYAKRSLGVKTWDMYDFVTYGQGGAPDGIIGVGGGGELKEGSGQKKAIRFKPIVFAEGPFHLKKGETRKHTFKMPNYIGSVRAMVVAKDGSAYGFGEKAVPVKTPLMILPTVPRVLSPGESLSVPVSVFAMVDNISNVTTEIRTNEFLTSTSSKGVLSFEQQGEQVGYFNLQTGDELGIGQIEVSASSGSHSSSQKVEVDIRNPMPYKTEVEGTVIAAGESWTSSVTKVGMDGTNEAIVELSQVPNLNLQDRMKGLIRYPYGCIEQTTSAVFPQLYLADMSNYISKDEIDRNIKSGIKRISKMEANGGFRYWPESSSSPHSWGTSYAGHFLIEASEKGYFVAQSMMRRWVDFQKTKSKKWKVNRSQNVYYQHQAYLDQAYRLYTLALHGTPALASMNLLRMESDLSSTSRFLLAASYALISKPDVALELIKGADPNISPYMERSGTFGSDLRDMSLIAQTMHLLDRTVASAEIIKTIATRLNSGKWYSTQSTAQALMAVGKFIQKSKSKGIKARLKIGTAAAQNIDYKKSIFTYAIDPDLLQKTSFEVFNNTEAPMFVSVQSSGQPSPSDILISPARNNNVSLSVTYTDLSGKRIDVTSITQGTDFLANVKVKNLNTKGATIEGMALTQILPSGWEIRSGRLNQVNGIVESGYDYRDIRDDRVHTFFDLHGTQTYSILLNATYEGTFFLPPISVEAMYDKSISASTKGYQVSVVRSQF